MKQNENILLISNCLFITFALILLINPIILSQGVYFDDSDPDIIKVGNTSYYEAAFRKTNGSFAYILDKATNQQVCKGSRYEVLWGSISPGANPSYIGSSSYTNNGANRFSYEWDTNSSTLQLNYIPDSTSQDKISSTVYVTFSAENYFDLKIKLHNQRTAGTEIVIFPSDFVFLESEMQDALLPIMPGLLLKSSFFTQARSYTTKYPGWPGVLSDYVALRATSGKFSMYSLYSKNSVVPIVYLGFVHDDAYINSSTTITHSFSTVIKIDSTWESPDIRIRISEDYLQTITNLRSDNKIDLLPSIKEVTGSKFTQISKSPMLKVGIKSVGSIQGYSNYQDFEALLPDLPSPSIFHLVEYNPGSFDYNYPDFIPPDPNYGTLSDFQHLFDAAHQYGLLVMPYTNPTWWDESSPTVLNQLPPLTINDIAVLDKNGNPRIEIYNNNDGFIVSPYNDFVNTRLDELMNQLTVDLPGDMIFEDQIGARGGIIDFNPASPSPTYYYNGWINHTESYADKILATEMGYDRLLGSEYGFYGGVLLSSRTDQNFINSLGEGNWEFFPFTALLARDKVMFYQHNLAPETATTDLKTLSHNIAMGYNLNFDLATGLQNFPEWLKVCGDFQKYALSNYADELMNSFTELQTNVSQYNYNTVNVTVNWDENSSFQYQNNVISPKGFYIESGDGNLHAGVLRAYNGNNLTSGDHYLIVSRLSEDSVLITQSLGSDTDISIQRPTEWLEDSLITVYAMLMNGNITSINSSLTGNKITFNLSNQLNGNDVDYYLATYNTVISVVSDDHLQIKSYKLFNNYPNPFNPATTIKYQVPKLSLITLKVFDVLGNEVAILVNEKKSVGGYEVKFNARNLSSGIYFYQLQAGNPSASSGQGFVETKKMILLR